MTDRIVGGRYSLGSRLGAGGMGSIYRGTDERLRREVAVKLLEELHSAPDAVVHFHREARAVAALRHANIVQIYDYSGPEEQPPYIIMELVRGASLEQLVGHAGPLSEPVMVSVLHPLASALGHAHACDVVHRDVTPSNVLVEHSGRVVLADFGLAKPHREASRLGSTMAGQHTRLLGTPGFMAPEQIRSKTAGPSSDVFALGALVYFMATGASPFDHELPVEVMRRVIDAEYEDLAARRRDLGNDIVELVRWCLQRLPQDRPTTAELIVQSERILVGNAVLLPQQQLQRALRAAGLHA